MCVCVCGCDKDGGGEGERVQRIGSIADYDPINERYGSLTHGYQPTSRGSSVSYEWQETFSLPQYNMPASPPACQ